MPTASVLVYSTMDIDDGRVLTELSRRLGALKTDEEATPLEKKLVKRIVALIGAWKAGDVEEEEALSVDGSADEEEMETDDDYVDMEEEEPKEPTTEEEKQLRDGYVRFTKRPASPDEVRWDTVSREMRMERDLHCTDPTRDSLPCLGKSFSRRRDAQLPVSLDDSRLEEADGDREGRQSERREADRLSSLTR